MSAVSVGFTESIDSSNCFASIPWVFDCSLVIIVLVEECGNAGEDFLGIGEGWVSMEFIEPFLVWLSYLVSFGDMSTGVRCADSSLILFGGIPSGSVDSAGEPVEVSGGISPFVSGLKVGVGLLPVGVVERWRGGSSGDGDVVSWALGNWSTGGNNFLDVSVIPGGLEDHDEDHDVQDTESDKNESKNLSSSEGSDETLVDGLAAVEGDSGVGEHGNSHSNVSRSNGCEGSGKERDGGVWEVGWGSFNRHLEEIDGGSKNNGK